VVRGGLDASGKSKHKQFWRSANFRVSKRGCTFFRHHPTYARNGAFFCRDKEDDNHDDDDDSPNPSAAAAMRVTEVIIDVRPRCPTPTPICDRICD